MQYTEHIKQEMQKLIYNARRRQWQIVAWILGMAAFCYYLSFTDVPSLRWLFVPLFIIYGWLFTEESKLIKKAQDLIEDCDRINQEWGI